MTYYIMYLISTIISLRIPNKFQKNMPGPTIGGLLRQGIKTIGNMLSGEAEKDAPVHHKKWESGLGTGDR